MVDTNVVEDVDTKTKVIMRPPSMYNVILYNDNVTTMQFVTLILMNVFHKSINDAQLITIDIHNNGKGIAGTYNYEIAYQKANETLTLARAATFPLRCEIDKV